MKNLIFFALLLKSVTLFSQDVSGKFWIVDPSEHNYVLEINIWGDLTQDALPDTWIVSLELMYEENNSLLTTCVDTKSAENIEFISILGKREMIYRQKRGDHAVCFSNEKDTFLGSYVIDDTMEEGLIQVIYGNKIVETPFTILEYKYE